jgi:hypothetical protein
VPCIYAQVNTCCLWQKPLHVHGSMAVSLPWHYNDEHKAQCIVRSCPHLHPLLCLKQHLPPHPRIKTPLFPHSTNNGIVAFANKSLSLTKSQPWSDVSAPGGSGTRVTCAGALSITNLIKSSEGYPSIFNSVLNIVL